MNKSIALLLTAVCFSGALFAQKTFTEPTQVLKGHTNDVLKIAQAPKGDLIASGSWDKSINVYTCADSIYQLKTTLSGHTFPVTALRFRNDGNMLASGSSDNTVILWDSLWRKGPTLEGHADQVNTLLFDRSNKYLFSGSDDRNVIAWDIKKGKLLRKINIGFGVNSIAQNNDPRNLYVAGANPQIRVYSLSNGLLTKTFDGHADAVNCIAISPNSKLLLSGSNDKTARIWDLLTGKQIRVLPVECWKVTAVAFSSDSKHAVTGCNDGSIKVWEVESGKLIAQITANGQYIKDIDFNKTATQVLTAATIKGSNEFGVRVWPSGIETLKPVPAPAAAKGPNVKPALKPIPASLKK